VGHPVRHLDLFVTEACNLACPYCFAAGHDAGELEPALASRALDWLLRSDAPRVQISLWGGEPLLRPDLLQDLVAKARSLAGGRGRRLTLSMPTNGTLLDAQTLTWLARNEVRIFLSIDGDEAAQRGRPLATGGSSYPLARGGLEAAAGLGLEPSVRMTVTPGNAGGLRRNAEHLMTLGARELLIYPAYDLPWSPGALAAFEAGQRDLAALLVRMIREHDDPGQVPRLKAWLQPLRTLLRGPRPGRPRRGPLRDCGAGRDLLALAVDGTFWPCHRYVFYARRRRDRGASHLLGHLQRGPDLARGEELLGGLRVEQMAGERHCVDCDLFDLCSFGCSAICYATTGDPRRVPPAACRLIRAQLAACRAVHQALAEDPKFALYLGEPLDEVLRLAAKTLGTRAQQLLVPGAS
jgi:uncharacterized protein